MSGYIRHDLPCDIVVHAGNFAGQLRLSPICSTMAPIWTSIM